jgi:hypothetical protein
MRPCSGENERWAQAFLRVSGNDGAHILLLEATNENAFFARQSCEPRENEVLASGHDLGISTGSLLLAVSPELNVDYLPGTDYLRVLYAY